MVLLGIYSKSTSTTVGGVPGGLQAVKEALLSTGYLKMDVRRLFHLPSEVQRLVPRYFAIGNREGWRSRSPAKMGPGNYDDRECKRLESFR